MKKLILFLFTIITFVSCTDNAKSRGYGGNMVIEVERGYKVTEVTWKDNSNLWYFIEPMDADYTPKTKKFVEKSAFGVIEGKVTFKESR